MIVLRRIRARQIERAYLRLARHYEKVPAPTGGTHIRPLTSASRFAHAWTGRLAREARILYVGTDYLQDTAGLLQALERAGDLSVFTQASGRYGQNDPTNALSLGLARANSGRLLDLVAEADARGCTPDIVVGQMLAGFIDSRVLDEIRLRFGCVVVNVTMDDRHVYQSKLGGVEIGTRALAPHVDLTATTAPECVEWYLKDGYPAVFWPEGSDPELFRPMPDLPKVHQIAFVGARYGIRQELVARLDRAGMKVATFGQGWPAGRIRTDDVPRLFAQAKIVLGVGTVGHSTQLLSLKMRDFDAPMSGSCYVTTANPDLETLYRVGEEIVLYDSPEHCVRQVGDLLRDDRTREAISARGRARAATDHTWDKRLATLFSLLSE